MDVMTKGNRFGAESSSPLEPCGRFGAKQRPMLGRALMREHVIEWRNCSNLGPARLIQESATRSFSSKDKRPDWAD